MTAGASLASSPATLAEGNLNGARLTVTLIGVTYASGVGASSFDLVTRPTINGLSIGGVPGGASGATTATLRQATGAGYGFSVASPASVQVHAAAHSGASNLTTGTLPVTPGPPTVRVSRRSLSLEEDPGTGSANRGVYSLVLSDPPALCPAGVGVSVASGNPDVTANPDALTFTATNWDTAQTVTVSAEQDDDGEHDRATLSHAVTTACDIAGYPATLAIPGVEVAVNDDDVPPPVPTDRQPTFGDATVETQLYTMGTAVTRTLPAATDGDGRLTHTPPTAAESTGGTLAGTPTAVHPTTTYTLTFAVEVGAAGAIQPREGTTTYTVNGQQVTVTQAPGTLAGIALTVTQPATLDRALTYRWSGAGTGSGRRGRKRWWT